MSILSQVSASWITDMCLCLLHMSYCLVVKGAQEVCEENMYGPPEI